MSGSATDSAEINALARLISTSIIDWMMTLTKVRCVTIMFLEAALLTYDNADVPLGLTLCKPHKIGIHSVTRASILFKITEDSGTRITGRVVSGAEDDAGRLREASVAMQAVLGGSGAALKIIEEDVIAWEPVIKGIQVFAGLVKDISNVRSAIPAVSVA